MTSSNVPEDVRFELLLDVYVRSPDMVGGLSQFNFAYEIAGGFE